MNRKFKPNDIVKTPDGLGEIIRRLPEYDNTYADRGGVYLLCLIDDNRIDRYYVGNCLSLIVNTHMPIWF